MSDKLTAQQEAFCRHYVEGNNQTDAYKLAYPNSKANYKSINERASRLMAQVKVSARVEQLKQEMATASIATRQEILEWHTEVFRNGEEKHYNRFNAAKEICDMMGYEAPKKQEVNFKGKPDVSVSFVSAKE